MWERDDVKGFSVPLKNLILAVPEKPRIKGKWVINRTTLINDKASQQVLNLEGD